MRHLLYGIIFCSIFAGCKNTSKKNPTLRATSPVASIVLIDDPIEEADNMRDFYVTTLGLHQYPFGKEYTHDFFQKLKQRKKSIIAWATTTKTTLVFIGQLHIDLTGADTQESLKHVERVQQWVFDQINNHASKTELITVEQFGTDERLTSEEMIRISIRDFQVVAPFLHMPIPTELEVRKMFSNDMQAINRAIREISSPPIYCGEEWPNALESSVLMRMNTFNSEQLNFAREFAKLFSHLRSEMILIRTLELMRKNHSTRGMIVQGAWHAQDIDKLGQKYHTEVTILLPPQN